VNSAALAILVLALIGAGLIYAAVYALFGKPSTGQGKKRKQEVISGFQLAGGILLMMASSGHLLNNPAIPVRRSFALTMAGLCFVTVFVTRRFTKSYKLHLAEKLA
jgi:hypothetical protein